MKPLPHGTQGKPLDPTQLNELTKLRKIGELMDDRAEDQLQRLELLSPNVAHTNPAFQQLAEAVQQERSARLSPTTGHTTQAAVNLERYNLLEVRREISDAKVEAERLHEEKRAPASAVTVSFLTHPPHQSAGQENILGSVRRSTEVRREIEDLEEEEALRRRRSRAQGEQYFDAA
ncbi:MAG: hypothetical protein PW734_01055 [Verrucomicrobium sp.]|nr:hypothetical protein [Verrucomicrobium sp.]